MEALAFILTIVAGYLVEAFFNGAGGSLAAVAAIAVMGTFILYFVRHPKDTNKKEEEN